MDNTTEKFDDFLFVTQEEITTGNPLKINTASPFKDLFPVKQNELERVMASMKTKGYDKAHPIILWEGHNQIVVDGHTRLTAAQKLLFAKIPVILKKFKDEAEALEYAIESQVNRRNLSDAELLKCVTELDKRMVGGRPKKRVTGVTRFGRSSENTASLLGTSRGKVENIRAINSYGTDEVKDAVKAGKLSVNKAYNETVDARKDSRFENEEDFMVARKTALQDTICGMIRNQILREMKKYPDSMFTEEAIAEMKMAIIETVNSEFKHITRQG